MLQGKIHTAHPIYYVRNLAASVAFYRDQLGLEMAWEMPEYKVAGVLLNAGALLVLCEKAGQAGGAGAPVFVLNIPDVDAAYNQLLAKGVVFSGPPSDEFYGRAVDVTDPDGYRLCLVSS